MSSMGGNSTSELSGYGLSGSTTVLSSYGSQTALSTLGMSSGGSSTALSTLGLGLGGSSTGLSTIGLGSSGLSGSNLGLSNLGLASLAGFGQMGGSSTGLPSLGLSRTGSFGGSREHISGYNVKGPQRAKDPFSRDVPGYRNDYAGKRDSNGHPPPPPPRDMSNSAAISGPITAAQPATSYSAPATPSHVLPYDNAGTYHIIASVISRVNHKIIRKILLIRDVYNRTKTS